MKNCAANNARKTHTRQLWATRHHRSPVPFSDCPLIATTHVAMIIHLSKIYGLEISKEIAVKLLKFLGWRLGWTTQSALLWTRYAILTLRCFKNT
ncbi:DUF697 domain-containing protein [Helicobacter ailurogastricus]|uniref:DUF697 domain-containing protein n=1 Tax=Helicobacter ailurogastricus TaxID=1578720 RepID=UPI000CF1BF06